MVSSSRTVARCMQVKTIRCLTLLGKAYLLIDSKASGSLRSGLKARAKNSDTTIKPYNKGTKERLQGYKN